VAAGESSSHADVLRTAPASARATPDGRPAAITLTPVATERIAAGFYLRYGKRLFDVVVGTALLIALLPLIVFVALAVLVTSGWPVFYRSARVGLDGREFQMWKFRTMVRDADAVSARWAQEEPELALEMERRWKVTTDPRITLLGGILRRSSLDELPQFVNVLRGEMSIVGPRPYLARETLDPLLAPSIVAVRPGLTGPFQTRGRNGMAPVERQKLEATYFRDVRLLRDVAYLLVTVRPLLRMDGH
jgi:lipopolysaccharide/colanic/teichoic acid biosynthesis glycosyltransferase